MANPRTPTKLRLLAGNPSNRPLPDDEPAYPVTAVEPPYWLGHEARKVWGKLSGALLVNEMLNDANYDILATYCDLVGDYIDKRNAGEPPHLGMAQQIRLLAREFGFTPSSQAGVSAPKSKKDDNKKSRFFK